MSGNSFQAGRLKHILPQWKTITADPYILEAVSGYKIEFDNLPMQFFPPRKSKFNDAETKIISAEIEKLLMKGVLVKHNHSEHNDMFF